MSDAYRSSDQEPEPAPARFAVAVWLTAVLVVSVISLLDRVPGLLGRR